MSAGRPRKSEAAKELGGTLDGRRVFTPKPSPIVGETYPEPPDYLNEQGIRAFKALIKHLRSVKSYWPVDDMMIGKAAFWMQLWDEAVMDVVGNTVQTFPNGTQQISPQLQVLDKAEAHVKKYYDLLGIGPEAREGLVAFQQSGNNIDDDPFDLLLRELEPMELPDTDS